MSSTIKDKYYNIKINTKNLIMWSYNYWFQMKTVK